MMMDADPEPEPRGFRSLLFAPGNNARFIPKVFHSGADVVILDLEDAVAVAEKDSARHDVVAALQHEGRVAAAAHCLGYMRVNAADLICIHSDMDAHVVTARS